MQIAQHGLMRSTNTIFILENIRDYGPITKREIQERTGLSWGAVSNITGDLLRKKVISEFKSADSLVGRTPAMLDINNTENLVIGLEVNAEGINTVLTDIKCRVLKKINSPVLVNEKNEILKQMKSIIHKIIVTSEINTDKLLGIGVAMQGSVNAEEGISVYSPYFNDWKDVPLGKILSDEFNVPVFVEHDPNCMALSEKRFGVAKDIKSFLFVRLSMGIGMSIITDGNIFRGADGSAGEFGHIIINPGGPRCSCGNYGCLEAYASGRSIIQKVTEGIGLGKIPEIQGDFSNWGSIDIAFCAELAQKGDPFTKMLFADAGVYLGIGISNLINIFNPELIILGGELARHSSLFIEKTRVIAKEKTWRNSRINLVISKCPDDSAAIGATLLIIQKIFMGEIKDIIT